MMSDWIGILFFVALATGAIVGLKLLARPRKTSAEQFERNAAEGTSLGGAGINALNEMLNPEAARSEEIRRQLKEGRFGKKRREGKSAGRPADEDDRILDAEIIE